MNIARICPQKNQLALAKAINELNKKGKNIELAIIDRIDNSSYSVSSQKKAIDRKSYLRCESKKMKLCIAVKI